MEVADEDMGMLPIYIGAKGEEEQGLCTGSENYWCVNKNASEEDIQATLDFLQWVVESDEGRDMLANTMGFVTPFTTFEDYLPSNPLVQANEEYNKAGKTPVSWNFTTMPSENWKNNVGSALLEYAQGTGKWDAVETAFVDGWATEYQQRMRNKNIDLRRTANRPPFPSRGRREGHAKSNKTIFPCFCTAHDDRIYHWVYRTVFTGYLSFVL